LKDVKDLTVMVVDNGIFCEAAIRMARDAKRVLYFPGGTGVAPRLREQKIGSGMPEIEVVDSPFKYHKEVDLYYFTDIYHGDMQDMLVSLDKPVWGSRIGQDMELKRDKLKKELKKRGLLVAPWVKIVGLTNLREYLKKNGEGKFVKVNYYRGIAETFHCINYREIESVLDDIGYREGPLREQIEFIVEDELPDCVEIGEDTYNVDGEFPSQYMSGIEVKDKSYVGIFKKRKEFPKVLTEWSDTMSEVFRRYGYRGFYSTEMRVNAKQEGYMIDFTARNPDPPSPLYMELYDNFTEIIWAGANGELIDPKPIAKFGVQIIFSSNWAAENWQEIIFPEKYRRNIKLKHPCKVEDRYYSIPNHNHWEEIGAVVAWGKTLESAIEEAKKIAEEIKGHGIEANSDSLDEAEEAIEKLDKFGVNYFKEEKNSEYQ